MIKPIKPIAIVLAASFMLLSCGSSAPALISTPLENIDETPLKNIPLSDEEYKAWGAADLATDTIPGMSVNKAYAELLKDRQGQTVIVGVIDSGVDIEHEDLAPVIWRNTDEIPNNGKDDDKNGYIDDTHGWNFLGDAVKENMEYVRIIKKLKPKYEGKTEASVAAENLAEFRLYQKAKAEYDKEYKDAFETKQYYENLLNQLNAADKAVSAKLGKENYTLKELSAMQADTEELKNYKGFLLQVMNNIGEDLEDAKDQLKNGIDYYAGRLNSHFNMELNGRAIVGDDVEDITDTDYGNNDVDGPDPKKEDAMHGTHVAGIIAAARNNGKGIDGVADNAKIMVLRAVPDGDEYDKDIALAIRYAVDNGAKVINTSFGKYFSTNPEWVIDAIAYAAKNDVLIVNAAGNEGLDLDTTQVYPNDQTPGNENEVSDTFLTVGALNYKYGSELVASFSNYGKSNVDVFAPGTKIWSTTPLNEYEFLQGTSMAAPAVAGLAATLRSYFPKLSAAQVKEIIIQSGLPTTTSVVVSGDPSKQAKFADLSVSGRMANLYNALLLADKVARKEVKLN